MARVSTTEVPSEFRAIRDDSHFFGENRDCAVKCVALACGRSYEQAHERLKQYGRRDRKGTPIEIIKAAIRSFGFHIKEWSATDRINMIWSYPGVHKGLSTITSHHPRRFAKAWANVHSNIVMGNNRHIWALKDRVVHDWSINKSLQVSYVWEIIKL